MRRTMLPNPENFSKIEVSGVKQRMGGFKAPYKVVGLKSVLKADPYNEGFKYEDFEEHILEDGFRNFQVAEYWMKQYLEMYVSVTYFENISLEGLYEDLDTDTQEG
jgi:hypothetical protein